MLPAAGGAGKEPAGSPQTIDRYQIGGCIGRGGMAEVYRGKLLGLGGFERDVAVKVLLPQLSAESEFVNMLLDEARIAGTINHGNVVQVLDVGQDGDVFYMVMEYVDGIDLRSVEKRQERGQVPAEPLLFVIAEVLRGLEAIHTARDGAGRLRQIVHRDVTPSNVLVTWNGAVKLADFGIAHATGRLTQTRHGAVKGKTRYMAPEQLDGKPIDHRTDLFAVGVVLLEALLGRDAADAWHATAMGPIFKLPLRLPPGVPRDVAPLLTRALGGPLEARYQSAAEFRRDVLRTLEARTRERGEALAYGADQLADFLQGLREAAGKRPGAGRGPAPGEAEGSDPSSLRPARPSGAPRAPTPADVSGAPRTPAPSGTMSVAPRAPEPSGTMSVAPPGTPSIPAQASDTFPVGPALAAYHAPEGHGAGAPGGAAVMPPLSTEEAPGAPGAPATQTVPLSAIPTQATVTLPVVADPLATVDGLNDSTVPLGPPPLAAQAGLTASPAQTLPLGAPAILPPLGPPGPPAPPGAASSAQTLPPALPSFADEDASQATTAVTTALRPLGLGEAGLSEQRTAPPHPSPYASAYQPVPELRPSLRTTLAMARDSLFRSSRETLARTLVRTGLMPPGGRLSLKLLGMVLSGLLLGAIGVIALYQAQAQRQQPRPPTPQAPVDPPPRVEPPPPPAEPPRGELQLLFPPGTRLLVDGAPQAESAPSLYLLPPGPHRLRIQPPRRREISRAVEIHVGQREIVKP